MKCLKPGVLFIVVVISIVMGITAVGTINTSILKSTVAGIYKNPMGLPNRQVALVLGAQVRPTGELSDMLLDRVLAGIELYKAGKVKKLLFSGDHGHRNYDEVNAMRHFALARGVPARDIFMDHAGFDTYSSLYRAKKVFQVKEMIIVTQAFHLPRALYIAHGLKISALGFVADRRRYAPTAERFSETREIPARVKAFFAVIFQPKPKFLGKVLPISGDGRVTWD